MADTVTDWPTFVSEYWRRRPAILRIPQATALTRSDYVFDVLLAAADAYRDGRLQDPNDIRLLLDEGTVNPGYAAEYYPDHDDTDLADYIRRVSAASRTGFSLVVNSVQQYSFELWCRARDFLSRLYADAGALPGGVSDCHIIAGRYQEAPTRVHKDTADVFTCVLTGEKQMWVWPYDAFACSQDARFTQVNLDVDYRLSTGRGDCLHGGPGDILYWPATYWHCAESDGRPHATLHLASYRDGNPLRTAHHLLAAATTRALAGHWVTDRPYPTGTEPIEPIDSEQAFGELRAILDSAELRDQWHAKWLKRLSSGNFEVVPPLAARADLGPDDPVRAEPAHPILINTRPGGDRTHIAANGHVFTLPVAPSLHGVLAHLNSGRTITARQLKAAQSDQRIGLEPLCALLGLLLRARALVRTDTGD